MLVKQPVDPVLHLGPVLHQVQAVAEELPPAPQLLAGDVTGEEHVGSEQPGEGLGVDLFESTCALVRDLMKGDSGLTWVTNTSVREFLTIIILISSCV